jgi:hypothetical protein
MLLQQGFPDSILTDEAEKSDYYALFIFTGVPGCPGEKQFAKQLG